MDVSFGAYRNGNPVPDKLIQGLSLTYGDFQTQGGPNVLGLAPSTTDVERVVQAFQEHGCDAADYPYTVNLEVAVLALR